MDIPKNHKGSYRFRLILVAAAAVCSCAAIALCFLANPTGTRDLFRRTHHVSGKVLETNAGDKSGLASVIVLTEKGEKVGIRTTEETLCFSFVDEMDWEAFSANPKANVIVSAKCFASPKLRMPNSGEEIPAYDAEQVEITGYLQTEAVPLKDGTGVQLWKYANAVGYTLENGVELLRVQNPIGPDHVQVAGIENLDALAEPVQKNILDFYRRQGLLYDTQALLEKAYAQYRALENPSGFDAFMVSQEILPSASNDTVIYYLTSVFLPIDSTHGSEYRIGAAFEKATGEPIAYRDLLSCSPEEAIRTCMDIAGIDDPVLRAEMEKAFSPESLIILRDSLEICFPQGTLPSQEYTYTLGLDYDDRLAAVLHTWAIPQRSSEKSA